MEGDHLAGGMTGLTYKISIHSLRMEGDLCNALPFPTLDISIHSLRMEGDLGRLFTF